jgi:hypothetical protein
MQLKRTPCCALLFMRASDIDNLNTMYEKLARKKKQLDQINWFGYGKGETTIQCIALPYEKILQKNLKKLGFKKKLTIDRREVSHRLSDTKTLEMYVLELKNLKSI